MIDPATIERIINTADIVEVIGDFVSLRKRGANHIGLCPFHNEKTPSFTVSPTKGIFKCFGCGRGGNVVNFIMEHEHYSYPEALKYLANKYHIEIEERALTEEEIKEQHEAESLFAVTSFAEKYFMQSLYENIEGISVGLSYFKERGLLQETLKAYHLGYCPGEPDGFAQAALKKGFKKEYLVKSGLVFESGTRLKDRFSGRIIFPIHSLSGSVQGFGGRTLKKDGKTAKYVNSPESAIYHKSNILYGIYQARKAITTQGKCFLVEGYTDVLSLYQNGIQNVVASSGTALTNQQVRLIKRFTKNITILYDGDEAGVKASLRGIDIILEEGMNVRIVLLPKGEDPDSFAKTHSSSELVRFINENEEDFISFKTKLLKKEAEKDPVGRVHMVREVVSSIAVIPDNLTRSVYLKECSTLLDMEENILYAEVNKIRRKKAEQNYRTLKSQEKNILQAIPASQTSQPAKDNMEYQEKALVRLLLLYGLKGEITIGQKPKQKKIPVAKYIIEELKRDDLNLDHPLYRQIYEEFVHFFFSEKPVGLKHFVNHQDERISKFSADLLSDRYQISKIWSRHDNFIETEEMQLTKIVTETVLAFKSKKVMRALALTEVKIKKAQDAGDFVEENLLLEQYSALNKVKILLSKNIGEITIL
ncbi:MAG: DNA primase [Chlorobi bacterium]|nr:DNA primase [Chlorobiota bacterium]